MNPVTILCAICHEPTERKSNNQLYCPRCRKIFNDKRRHTAGPEPVDNGLLVVIYDPHGLSLEGKEFTLEQTKQAVKRDVFVNSTLFKQGKVGYVVRNGQLLRVAPKGQGDILFKTAEGEQALAAKRKLRRAP